VSGSTPNELPLDGSIAIVTGGGSSIGLGSARKFVLDGSSVLIVGRNAAKLARAEEVLRAEARAGARVGSFVADVTDETQLLAAFASIDDWDGALRICVASAGEAFPTPMIDGDYEKFRAVVDLNLNGLYLTIRSAARAMRDVGGGSIVGVSSTSAVSTIRGLSGYCASKAGADMLVRVAADELGPLNIRVNSVRPGLTRREAASPIFSDPDTLSAILDRVPLGRTGTVEDSAAIIRFLAGPESSWITGTNISVDGGSSLRGGLDLTRAMTRGAPAVDATSPSPE
jgi:NAD(P)-dependent dehydrogenase (short-subunit alcohol dehydrogenase family)